MLITLILLAATPGVAQTSASAPAVQQLTSADGRRSVVAVEASTPVTLDGALDEEVWRTGEPAGGFIQAEPHEGQPASEPTEVHVAFDRDALYVDVICRDSASSDRKSTRLNSSHAN